MSPAYTITAVADNIRDWNTKKGDPWKSYRVTLRNERGVEKENVEVSRPATDPVPKAGEVVEGTVENREQYGPKLNVPRRGGAGGGWKPKPPEERRSIAMQHAQKCAVTILQSSSSEFVISTQEVVDTAWVLFQQVLAAETQDRPTS